MNKINVLVSVPPGPFIPVSTRTSLEALQELIGGGIEFVYLGREDVDLLIDGESLIKGLLPNREANRLFRNVIGYRNLLCGPVAVLGRAGDGECDIPPQAARAIELGIWPPPDL